MIAPQRDFFKKKERELKERRCREQGFEERERCSRPPDLKAAHSRLGADESRRKVAWRAGDEEGHPK